MWLPLLPLLGLTFSLHAGAALQLPNAPNALLASLSGSGGNLWAVGERGHLFQVEEGQLKQQPFPYDTFLTGVDAHRGGYCVVGHDALLACYQEGEWSTLYHDPDLEAPFFSLAFSKLGGIAVGAYGIALVERASGEWERITLSEEDPHYYMVKADSLGNWYLAGEFGTILKASPSGELITLYETAVDYTFFGIEVLDEDRWVAYGLRGRVFFYDGELQQLESPVSSSLYCSCKYKGKTLLGGADGTLLLLDNGRLTDLSLEERVDITDMMKKEGTLYLATRGGLRTLELRSLIP